ncbi:hypothetical protein CMT48_17285 [Elizabethkingia anophelis]|nr:hypothetical protein [Elizabethkingia anophelis]
MAELNVGIGADITELVNKITEVKKKIEDTFKSVDLSGVADAFKELEKSLRQVGAQNEIFGKSLDSTKKELKAYQKAFEDLVSQGLQPTHPEVLRLADEIDRLSKEIADAEKKTKSFKERVDEIGNVGQKLSDLGGALTKSFTVPILAFGAAAIKSYGDIQALQLGLESVMGSAEKAAREFERLKEVAKLPGLGMEEAVKGAINLQSIGIGANKARNILQQFGNAVATVGKGRAEFERAIYGVQQLANTDFPLGEDLNIIKDALPQVSNLLKDAFGTSRSDELAKLGITSQQVLDTIIKGLEKLPRVAGGINGAFENMADGMKTSLSRIGKILDKAFDLQSIVDKIVSFVDKVITAFENLSPEFQRLTIIIAGVVAAIGPLLTAVGAFIQFLPTIVAGVEGVGVVLTALTGPIGLVTLGIVGIVAAVTANWGKIKPYVIDTINYFIRLYNESIVVRAAVHGIATAFKNQFTIVKNVLKTSWEIIKTFAKGVADTFSGVGNVLEGAFTADPTKITKGVKQIFSAQIDTVKSLGKDLQKGFTDIYDGVVENIKTGYDNVVNFKPIAYVTDLGFDFSIASNKIADDTEDAIKKGLAKGKDKAKKEKKTKDPNYLDSQIAASKRSFEAFVAFQTKIESDREELMRKFDQNRANYETELSSKQINRNASNLNLVMEDIASKSIEFNKAVNDLIASSLSSTISDMFSSIGEAISNGGNIIDAIGSSLLESLGGFIKQLGSMMVQFGVLGLLFGKLQVALMFGDPFTKIGAALALIGVGAALNVLGGAISGAASGRGGGSSVGGNVSSYSGSNTPSYSSNALNSGSSSKGEVVFRISGNDLVGVLNQEQNRQRRTNS